MLMQETQLNALGHTHRQTQTDTYIHTYVMKIGGGLEKKEFAKSPTIQVMLPQQWHIGRGPTLVHYRLSGCCFRICEFL